MNPQPIRKPVQVLKGGGGTVGAASLQDLGGRSAGTSAPSPSAQSAACTPSAELIELNGVVHAIQITCACGERTTIELDYAGDPK